MNFYVRSTKAAPRVAESPLMREARLETEHQTQHHRQAEEPPSKSNQHQPQNAVTPMTFLFLQTCINVSPCSTIESVDLQVSDVTTLNLTRSGQGVTLFYLSFYEPESTFKCLNEVLYLMTLPALDEFFRDKNTGKLKMEWTFVVDNGPSEQPSCPLA